MHLTHIEEAHAEPGSAAGRDVELHFAGAAPTPRRPIRKRGVFAQARATRGTLVYHGHVLMENRDGVAVAGGVTRADGSAERAAALERWARWPRRCLSFRCCQRWRGPRTAL